MPAQNTRKEKVRNIETFLNQLPPLDQKMSGNYFYRGQSKAAYGLLPSVLRGGMEEKEHEIYTQIMTECSHEFEGIVSHGEILSKMQHYGVFTRLLDITSNPLVALYFTCESKRNRNKDGKVFVLESKPEITKNFDSDAISILSCLPRFDSSEKLEIINCVQETMNYPYRVEFSDDEIRRFNDNKIIKRLLHEVKKEKPAFENIINPSDLMKEFFFFPKKNNARIIRQSGAFIIFGLRDTRNRNKYDANSNYIKKEIIIDRNSKSIIIDQLSCFGISKATLYPELYKVAEYLNDKYKYWL